ALGPARSLVDRAAFWEWLSRAAAARARPGDFSDVAAAAASGPLGAETRGRILDLLMDADAAEAPMKVLGRGMRAGQPIDPALARRIERLRGLRRGGGR